MLVHRVIDDLGKYLVQRRSESGTMVYNWYHRQFWQTAKQRYLSDPAVREKLHGVLATYFTNSIPPSLEHDKRTDIYIIGVYFYLLCLFLLVSFSISGQISPQPMVLNHISVWSDNSAVNLRRIVEGSHHLLHAGKDYFNNAINELCDIDNICAFISAGTYTILSTLQQLLYSIYNYLNIYYIMTCLQYIHHKMNDIIMMQHTVYINI